MKMGVVSLVHDRTSEVERPVKVEAVVHVQVALGDVEQIAEGLKLDNLRSGSPRADARAM